MQKRALEKMLGIGQHVQLMQDRSPYSGIDEQRERKGKIYNKIIFKGVYIIEILGSNY